MLNTSRFKIEKNVPITGTPTEFTELAMDMEYLDSVVVETELEKRKLTAALNNRGFGYKTRREGGTQFRIWKLQKHRVVNGQ